MRCFSLLVLTALLLAACGPAAHLPPINPPLKPDQTVTPWAPVEAPLGASPTPSRSLDRSLISQEPCAPPCWQGLEPGLTSPAEVEAFLANSPYVGEALDPDPQSTGPSRLYQWFWAPPALPLLPNAFAAHDETLTQINLWLELPLLLNDLLPVYGAPEQAHLQTSETGEWVVEAYYPSEGLSLRFYGFALDDDGSAICPASFTEARAATYVPAGELDAMIAAMYPTPTARDSLMARLFSWDGVACIPLEG